MSGRSARLVGTAALLALACGRIGYDPRVGDAAARDRVLGDREVDGETDGGEEPVLPGDVVLRFPWNGFATGSVHVAAGAAVADDPLRPMFRWEPVDDAAYYQLQVDDSCAPERFVACAFTSPEVDEETSETSLRASARLAVSLSAPVGRRYSWRVRACPATGSCYRWSTRRYLDVGRQAKDFNGDGYADVVIAAQGTPASSVSGAVRIYAGSSAGVGTAPTGELLAPAGERGFGTSIAALGDVNADGFADLAVGAPAASVGAEGPVFVYLGSAMGLPAAPAVTLHAPASQPGGISYGWSVAAAGDVNGDGYADLAVGAPAYDSDVAQDGGAAYVYHGSAGGFGEWPSTRLEEVAQQDGAAFGSALGGGADLDGDGYCDLAVGEPLFDAAVTDEGRALAFRGARVGINTSPMATLTSAAPRARANMGNAVALVGDTSGDGFAELAVGAHQQDNPESVEGVVYFYLGARGALRATPDETLDNPDDGTDALFGRAVAGAGDVDADGFADLVGGAPASSGPEVIEGDAYVFRGRAGGIAATPFGRLDNPSHQQGGFFGGAVAGAGDVNGDGFADIVIGAMWQGSPYREGAAFLYYGGPSGVGATPDERLENPANHASDFFGSAVD